MTSSAEATRIVVVSLDAPLEPLEIEARYREVLLVVKSGGDVVGEVYLPALTVLPTDVIAGAIAWTVGDRWWKARLRRQFLAAVCVPDPPPAAAARPAFPP